MKRAFTVVAAAGLAAALPAPASATQLLYSLNPVGGTGYRASWTLDSNPLPTQAVEGQGFAIERVAGTFPRTTGGDAYLDFFVAANGGGLAISDADGPGLLATLYGAQLYGGSEAAPIMLRGVFTLTTSQNGGRRYALTVSDAIAAVPEPATWFLMIVGTGLIGAALRHRRRVAARFA